MLSIGDVISKDEAREDTHDWIIVECAHTNGEYFCIDDVGWYAYIVLGRNGYAKCERDVY